MSEEVADIGLMLVTANVGSLFEDPTRLLQIWLDQFLHKVGELQPKFIALHLQEVGGKTYEKSMEHVQDFIRRLCDAEVMKDFAIIQIFLDEDFKSAEHFTALGNLYFAHKSITTLRIWNFFTHLWEFAENKNIYSGNIETISTKEKSKFPQHFFPECKWSRKGFMRTRWDINGTAIDLVNIHLFHDASNLVACEEFPSVYCKTRRRALVHTLERFHLDDKNGFLPFFVFGDFNFRCDTDGVIKELTENLTVHREQSVKNESTKIHYRNSFGNNVLTVGKKEFTHADHQLKFKEDWLKKFDRELEALNDILEEFPINFSPSYPFEEDPEMPSDYMSTRCPSWCDRILMSSHMKNLIAECVVDGNVDQKSKIYNVIGENVCMGDHKPIYLNVYLKANKGTYRCCDCKQNYANNNKSTSLVVPAVSVQCPYKNHSLADIRSGRQNTNRENLHYFQTEQFHLSNKMFTNSQGSVTDADNNLMNVPNALIEATQIEQIEDGNRKYLDLTTEGPGVTINIIDSDNIYVCMCAQMSTSKDNDNFNNDGSICPVCQNIIKRQPTEHRYGLISKRLMLSDNIIVNRIDTQHLNTYFEYSTQHQREDPYTPESNESHSPYPELNSATTTNTSSDSRSPYDEMVSETITSTQILLNNDALLEKTARSNMIGIDSISKASELTIGDKQQKGVVTPGQLKSRLEDLQKITITTNHLSKSNEITAGKSDVDDVDEVCQTSKSKFAENSQRRNFSYLPKCCNIH